MTLSELLQQVLDSGSLGVVLRPCLVVVLVAILNKQVTTDELFSRGFQVFVLTASLYLVAMLLRNKPLWRTVLTIVFMLQASRPSAWHTCGGAW